MMIILNDKNKTNETIAIAAIAIARIIIINYHNSNKQWQHDADAVDEC